MERSYLFTSESVSNGHPDKIADAISDAILDAYLEKDSHAKVACETLITDNLVVISGEFKTNSNEKIDIDNIARRVLKEIGYHKRWGFDPDTCEIKLIIKDQANEIYNAVELGTHNIGAGDQGIMFGYACNETPELMPLPIMLAHKLMIEHNKLRRYKEFDWLGPDAKSQVTVQYIDFKPLLVDTVVFSSLHGEKVSSSWMNREIQLNIINEVIPVELKSDCFRIFVNPSGAFTEGGPKTDTGLTGRKIMVDTYGGSCPHGGGAFSGKDPTKVDRSGAYMARYIAKNIVAADIAERCLVQIAYAIGRTKPVSLYVNTYGTGKISDMEIETSIEDIFDLSPQGIIDTLQLERPIYSKTTNFGHFGRELPYFNWEKTDKVEDLKNRFNIK